MIKDRMEYRDIFERVVGNSPYQTALATESELPQLLDVPTGCKKTVVEVRAWLWRRRFATIFEGGLAN